MNIIWEFWLKSLSYVVSVACIAAVLLIMIVLMFRPGVCIVEHILAIRIIEIIVLAAGFIYTIILFIKYIK